jgi:hypothetical protein
MSLVLLSLHHPLVVLRKLVVASSLIALPSRPIVMPPSHPLVVLSLCRPLVVSSHWLVVVLPLVAPPSCHPLTLPLSLSCAGWLLCRLSSCRPLILPPSCSLLILSLRRPLVVSSHWLVVAMPLIALPSRCPLTPPLSCRLALAGCCVASSCAALLSSCHATLSLSSTLNLLSLGFPDPFDATFVVARERSSRTSSAWPLVHTRRSCCRNQTSSMNRMSSTLPCLAQLYSSPNTSARSAS